MFRTILLLLLALTISPVLAQNNRSVFDAYRQRKQAELDAYQNGKHKQLTDYQERKHREFEAYRKRKSQELAEYLSRPWAKREQMDPVPVPTKPDPVDPPVAPEDDVNPEPIKPVDIPKPDVKPIVLPEPSIPEPIPLPEPKPRPVDAMQVSIFGMKLDVAMTEDMRFSMNSVKPEAIKKVMNMLDGDKYTMLFEDFARYSEDLHLNGWAGLCLSKAIANQLLGEESNEATVLQLYLMAIMGYDVKPLNINNRRLAIMYASNMSLCGIHYIMEGKKKYYIDEEFIDGTFVTTPDADFKGGTCAVDFAHATQMQLDNARTRPKVFQSKKDENVVVEISVNKSLMNYYQTLPIFQNYSFYAGEPIEAVLSRQLMPTLREFIIGMTEREAANLLIHFVQTAFDYMTDQKQFNAEKPFFKEELFYHRYSDCEDRAILYTGLVEELLGLDVVLLHYPNHMCTAVKFNESISGDYLTIDGQQYLICDPCYIAADIGRCMPQYRGVKPEVLKIR